MLIKKIRELQVLCVICLSLQLFLYQWLPLFHLIAVILSCVVIANTKVFRCIDCQYNYYLICLFIFRILVNNYFYRYLILSIIYYCSALYIIILLLLVSYRCLL